MPSSLPTTFSPGLFYLEALDYAGFRSKCSIHEVFNLISTSSEFMNSAILPQYFTRRPRAVCLTSIAHRFPLQFSNSLQYVRKIGVIFDDERPPELERLSHETELNRACDLVRFVDFVENTSLFGFYLTHLSVFIEEEAWEKEALLFAQNSFHLPTQLESLHLKVPLTNCGRQVVDTACSSFFSSLNSLNLQFNAPRASHSREFRWFDLPIPSSLCKFRRLESLTLRTCVQHEINSEISLTKWNAQFDVCFSIGSPICNTLKVLHLELAGTAPSRLAPLANFRQLRELVISNMVTSHGQNPASKAMRVATMREICEALAEPLTCLRLQGIVLSKKHVNELRKLHHLQVLDIGSVSGYARGGGGASILDFDDFPCFDILRELKLTDFYDSGDPNNDLESYQRFCRRNFAKMKSLERLECGLVNKCFECCLDCMIDDLDPQAPLNEISWNAENSLDVPFRLPQQMFPTLLTLKMHFRTLERALLDPLQLEVLRIPLLFPNLQHLVIGGCNIPSFEQALPNLLSLTIEYVFVGFEPSILQQSISNNMFPRLRTLKIPFCKNTAEFFMLCRTANAKLKFLERFEVEGLSQFQSAKAAHFARSLCPFLIYQLRGSELWEEFQHYRSRREFTDDGDDYDECEEGEYYEEEEEEEEEEEGHTHDEQEDFFWGLGAGTRRERHE